MTTGDPACEGLAKADAGESMGLGASDQTGWTALVASLALGWPR